MQESKYFYKGIPLSKYCKDNDINISTIRSRVWKKKQDPKYSDYSEQQLNKMGHSTGFMKAIVDYAYPDMILYRAKVFEQSLKKKYTKAAPFVEKDKDKKYQEQLLKSYLTEALIIN